MSEPDCERNEAGECINTNPCMHDAPPVPAELVPLTVGFWDAQLRTVLGLAKEVRDDLTTKRRLQQIAMMCVMQLVAMLQYAAEQEAAEQATADLPTGQPLPDNMKVENRIIVPDNRLVVP